MGRRTLTANTAWDDVYEAILYSAVALKLAQEDGDKEVGALHGGMDKLLGKWKALDGERQERRRDVVLGHALVKRRDAGLEAVMMKLHNSTLAEVEQDRKDPLFKRLFPKSLSTVNKQALESQLAAARELQKKLAEAETPAALRKEYEKAMKEAIAAGAAALERRETALVAYGQAAARCAALRDEVNQATLQLEGALKQVMAKRKLGTGFLDSFFPTVKSPTKKTVAPQPVAPAPA
jgi:hypothetical protein